MPRVLELSRKMQMIMVIRALEAEIGQRVNARQGLELTRQGETQSMESVFHAQWWQLSAGVDEFWRSVYYGQALGFEAVRQELYLGSSMQTQGVLLDLALAIDRPGTPDFIESALLGVFNLGQRTYNIFNQVWDEVKAYGV